MAEPSARELGAMATVAHVLAWVPVPDDLAAVICTALGVQPDNPLRLLANIEKEDLLEARAGMRLAEHPLPPAAKGMVVNAWHVARLAAGLEKSRESIKQEDDAKKEEKKEKEDLATREHTKLDILRLQAEVAKNSSKTATSSDVGTVNLAIVFDQTMTGVIPLLPKATLIKYHGVYETKTEGECPAEERPTDDQLTAIDHVYRQNSTPPRTWRSLVLMETACSESSQCVDSSPRDSVSFVASS